MSKAKRIAFTLQVRKDKIDAYKVAHANVWPEMCQALSDTGWTNYSLFLRDDGLLIGYLETENFEAALVGMSTKEVNHKWQAEMGDFFESTETSRPDERMYPLEEVFHLD